MKYLKFLLTALFIAASLNASDHNSTSDLEKVEKQAQEFGKTLQSFSIEKKDQTVRQMKNYLEKADKRIDIYEQQIDKNWNSMSQKAKKQYKHTLKQLRKERNQLSQAYGEMKQSSKKAWKDVKKGTLQSYERFEKGLKKAWKDVEQ